GGPMAYSSSPGVIGQHDPNTNKDPYFMKGTIDDIRYWNRALTQEEVELLCNSNLSINENKEDKLLKTIYPNPSNGTTTLVFGSTKPVNITLYDITGKIMLHYNDYIGSELTIKDLKQGVYFVKIYNEQGEAIQRIVVTN
ncbi:MAG: T9SS type A sorting domain-containing protein, partial [Bacteroidia bacterium]